MKVEGIGSKDVKGKWLYWVDHSIAIFLWPWQAAV
jgi:hypothetical protein